MAKKKEEKQKFVLERNYNIPLRKSYMKAPRWKRTKKAVNALREFLVKHMKSDTIKIQKYLNLHLWKHGIKNPPHHVKVTAKKDEKGVVVAELTELPKEAIAEKAAAEKKKKELEKKKEAKKPAAEKKETKKDDIKIEDALGSEDKKDDDKTEIEIKDALGGVKEKKIEEKRDTAVEEKADKAKVVEKEELKEIKKEKPKEKAPKPIEKDKPVEKKPPAPEKK